LKSGAALEIYTVKNSPALVICLLKRAAAAKRL